MKQKLSSAFSSLTMKYPAWFLFYFYPFSPKVLQHGFLYEHIYSTKDLLNYLNLLIFFIKYPKFLCSYFSSICVCKGGGKDTQRYSELNFWLGARKHFIPGSVQGACRVLLTEPLPWAVSPPLSLQHYPPNIFSHVFTSQPQQCPSCIFWHGPISSPRSRKLCSSNI